MSDALTAAMKTLDRVATVGTYTGSVGYPGNGFGQAMRAVAGAMVRGIGTRVFYVTTGGFDTHANQNPNAATGTYYNLMGTLNDGLIAFYNDLKNQGLLDDTLVVLVGEFGRIHGKPELLAAFIRHAGVPVRLRC